MDPSFNLRRAKVHAADLQRRAALHRLAARGYGERRSPAGRFGLLDNLRRMILENRTTEQMGDNAAVALEAIRAVEERDIDGLFALYHEDVEFHDAPSLPYGGSRRGKHVLRRQLEETPESSWIGTWGPLQPTERERRMDPRVIAESEAEVAVLYRQRALQPSGERLDAPVVGLYEIRDGRFARAQMFHFDTVAVVDFLAGRDRS